MQVSRALLLEFQRHHRHLHLYYQLQVCLEGDTERAVKHFDQWMTALQEPTQVDNAARQAAERERERAIESFKTRLSSMAPMRKPN